MAPPISAALPAVSARLSSVRAARGPCEQRHERQQGHDRHVLEQQDREGALAVRLLQLAALLQDAQRDRRGGEREREARDQRAAPFEPSGQQCEATDRRRGERQLGDTEAENVAPHREQAGQLELEPDQEQQHHDAQLGDREDALGRIEQLQPVWADDHARQQIGDDRREPREAGDWDADHRGGEQHEGEAEQGEACRMIIHWLIRTYGRIFAVDHCTPCAKML